MSGRTHLINRAYGLLLRLYPRQFRAKFEDEMHFVFARALTEAGEHDGRSVAVVCLRELRDCPPAALREHWFSFRRGKEATMNKAIETNSMLGSPSAILGNENEPGSWKDATLAALPHLIVALMPLSGLLGSALPKVWMPSGAYLFVSDIAAALLILVALMLAWRRGWPRWSASLYGYGFAVAVMMIGLPVTQVLPGRLWAGAFLYIMSPLALAWLLYRTFQQDRLKGLLALLPVVMVLWNPVLEFVQPRAFVSVGAWLLMALIAATIIRWGNVRLSVWMILAFNLMIGACITYARTYLNSLPPEHAEVPTLERMVNRLSPPLLAVSALVIGLWLVWVLWQIGKCGGRTGRLGHRLVLAGLLLNLIDILGAAWWYTSPYDLLAYGDIRQIGSLMLKGTTYLGFSLYVLGVLLLGVATWRSKAVPQVSLILLLIIPAALPLIMAFPMLFDFSAIPTDMPLGLALLNHIPRGGVYAVGLAWLLLGGWLVTRLGRTNARPDTTAQAE
jgi:hypothetical protein